MATLRLSNMSMDIYIHSFPWFSQPPPWFSDVCPGEARRHLHDLCSCKAVGILKIIESDCKCSIFRIWLLLTIAIIVIVTINDYHCHYYYYYYPLRIVIITINDWHPNFPFWQIPAVPAQLTDGFTCPGSPSRCNLPQKNCGRTKMSCWGPSKAPWWSKDLFIWLWVNTY